MAELSLTALFGENATQNSTDLVIKKSDLVAMGLTATANNNPESLLVALIKFWATAATEEARDANIDQSIAVYKNEIPSITSRLNGNTSLVFIRDTFTVELDKQYSATDIDPDNY